MRCLVLRSVISPSAFVLLVVAGGCAVHNRPAISDVTHLSSYDILEKMKCEAAEALDKYSGYKYLFDGKTDPKAHVEKLQAELDKTLPADYKEYTKTNAYLAELAAKNNETAIQARQIESEYAAAYEVLEEYKKNQPVDSNDRTIRRLTKKVRHLYFETKKLHKLLEVIDQRYKNTKEYVKNWKIKNGSTIATYVKKKKYYDNITTFLGTEIEFKMNLQVLEHNDSDLTTVLKWPVKHGTKSEGPGLGADLQRKSIQQITVAAKFHELIFKDCPGIYVVRLGNPARYYPITGNTGVDSFIDEFVSIDEANPGKSKDDLFSDQVVFTTEISGGLNPKIDITPVSGSQIQVGATLQGTRTDTHNVTLTIKRAVLE